MLCDIVGLLQESKRPLPKKVRRGVPGASRPRGRRPDILRTSGVIRADIPAQNFGQGAQNPGKSNHLGADTHDPKVRTSTILRDFQKLRSEKLWTEFSFPILARANRDTDTPSLSPKHHGCSFSCTYLVLSESSEDEFDSQMQICVRACGMN